MAYKALTDVLLGNAPAAKAGDILPDTYPDMHGVPVAVDADRLVAIGAAEKIPEPSKPAAKRARKEQT